MTIRRNATLGMHVALYLFLGMLLLPISLYAECQVTLTWGHNSSSADGYRLYQRESGERYNYNIFTDMGQSTSVPVTGLSEDTTYHFVVRAYAGSVESGNSNEVSYNCSNGSAVQTTGGSNPPAQPLAIAPADQTMDISLQPTLTTSAFIDHDPGDYHAQTRWTIYRLDDDACILDITSNSALTSLAVPSSTLSPFTSYYWTVYYYDQNGDASAPSQVCDFTTQQATTNTSEDTNDTLTSSLSSGSSSGGGGSSGLSAGEAVALGGGCFIQALLGNR